MTTAPSNPLSGVRRSQYSENSERSPQENLYGTVLEIIAGDNEVGTGPERFSHNEKSLREKGIPYAIVRLETPYYNKKGEIILQAGSEVAMITPPPKSENGRRVSNMLRPVDNQAYIGPNSVISMRRAEFRTPRSGEDDQLPVIIANRMLNVMSEDRLVQPQFGQESEYFNAETRDNAKVFPKALFSSGYLSVKRPHMPERTDGREPYYQQSVTMIENDRAVIIEPDAESGSTTLDGVASVLDAIIKEVNILATPGINLILFRNPDENGEPADPSDLGNRMTLTLAAWNRKVGNTNEYRTPTGREVVDGWRENVKDTFAQEVLQAVESGEWTVVAIPALISQVGGSLRVDSEKNKEGNDLSVGCMIFDHEAGNYSRSCGFVPAVATFGVYTRLYNDDGSEYERGEFDNQGQALERGRGGHLIPTGALPPGTHVQMSRNSMFSVMQRSGSVFDSLDYHEALADGYQKWLANNPSASLAAQAAEVKRLSHGLLTSSADIIPMGGKNMALYNEDIPLPASVTEHPVVGLYQETIQKYLAYVESRYADAIEQAKSQYPRNDENSARPNNSRPAPRSSSPSP